VKRGLVATRTTAAVILCRMYSLPETDVDYFSDDDGDAAEHWHNSAAAPASSRAGTTATAPEVQGRRPTTRSQLATLAARARTRRWSPSGPLTVASVIGRATEAPATFLDVAGALLRVLRQATDARTHVAQIFGRGGFSHPGHSGP